jgi:hypothetical protein
MPWRWAISNNSTIAHSTIFGLGSAGCRLLFIGPFISDMHFFVRHNVTSNRFSEILARSSAAVCSKRHTFANNRSGRPMLSRTRRCQEYPHHVAVADPKPKQSTERADKATPWLTRIEPVPGDPSASRSERPMQCSSVRSLR